MKVEIRKIETYNLKDLEAAVSEYLNPSRLRSLAKAKKILVKPNCLGAFSPEKAITTHPMVLEAIIIHLLKLKKQVWLGDSPGGSVSSELVWEKTGIKDLAERYPIKLVNLSTFKSREVLCGDHAIRISNAMNDCDGIINVAKYKTHSLMAFTGAVKNLYGLIPGLVKTEYHRQNPDTGSFGTLIAELYKIVKPKLIYNFIDGIEGMDGAGPSAGRKRNFGLLFGSVSAPAVDMTAAGLMGFTLRDIPYMEAVLHSDGLLPSRIEIPNSFRSFKLHNVDINTVKIRKDILRFVPSPVAFLFKTLFKQHPEITARCKNCGICIKSCPVKAITRKPGELPIINPEKCIKCMCCHEMCPHHAIDIIKSPLVKLIMGA